MKEIVAVLADIRSLHNVGSIFRTADGAGILKLYLCGITPTPYDRLGKLEPQFAKVALGAEKSVAWEHCGSITALLKRLKKDGYALYAIEQDERSMPYWSVNSKKLPHKAALIIGSETKGISKAVLALADRILEIPMRGSLVRHAHHPRRTHAGKESLNVSVAFGIVAYHFLSHAKK